MDEYEKRLLKQTEDWMNGKCIHNYIDKECCPDFSCCHPGLFEPSRLKRLIQLNKLRVSLGLPTRLDA